MCHITATNSAGKRPEISLSMLGFSSPRVDTPRKDMNAKLPQNTTVPLPALPPISLTRFQELSGWSSSTTWRMRRRGWLEVIRICGRCYVMPEAIMQFNERAIRGEFVGAVQNPGAKQRNQQKARNR